MSFEDTIQHAPHRLPLPALECSVCCMREGVKTKDKREEEDEEEEEGSTAAQDIDKMDDTFIAAFKLLRREHRPFVVACQAVLEEWGMEEYELFKDSVYLSFRKAVKDGDQLAVMSTLRHYMGANL